MTIKISEFHNIGITEGGYRYSLEHRLSSIKKGKTLDSDRLGSYKLDKVNSSKNKLVFKNVNHLKMLHEYLKSSYFYVALIALPILLIFHENSKGIDSDGNVTSNFMFIIISLGILFLVFKGLMVPYRIVFDHLTIYEQNLFTRKINVLYSERILTTNVNDRDFVIITSEEQSLFIMENEQFEVIELLRNHFGRFSFESHL